MHMRWSGFVTVIILAASACSSDDGGGGPAPPCPTAEPASGDACTKEGFRCTYGESVRPDCRSAYVCTSGAGVADTYEGACADPPPGACGPTEPAYGDLCTGFDGATCTYGDDICFCTTCYTDDCMLGEETWACPPTGAGCPPVAPNDGTPCET